MRFTTDTSKFKFIFGRFAGVDTYRYVREPYRTVCGMTEVDVRKLRTTLKTTQSLFYLCVKIKWYHFGPKRAN